MAGPTREEETAGGGREKAVRAHNEEPVSTRQEAGLIECDLRVSYRDETGVG